MTLDWIGTWWAVVYVLAAARVTILITRDSLPPMARMRDYVSSRWGRSDWSELIVCPWCMGFWVSVGAFLVASTPADTVGRWVAVPFAMSTVVGLLASRE